MYEYGEAAYLERLYEQYQRDEERNRLATPTTAEEDEEATFRAQEMFNTVSVGDSYPHKCFVGREPVFYMEWNKGLIPGHIYSRAGKDEFEISRTCEYHFDEMFGDDDGDVPQDSDAF
jgi:hypothetical protein